MHRTADIADPRLFTDDVSDRTADIVMKAMAKHPERRFDRVDQMLAALRGESDLPEHLPAHCGWSSLKQYYADEHQMAAPLESSGAEWVVYLPPTIRDELRGERRVYRELVGDYLEHITPCFSMVRARLQSRDGTHSKFLKNRGVARGLSSRGARAIQDRLDSHGILARVARRPRSKRHESWLWQRVASSLSIDIGLFGLLCISVVGALLLADQSVATLDPAPLTAGVVIIGLIAGFLVGCIGIWRGLREWWLSRISTSYLLDFSKSSAAEKAQKFIGRRHFRLLESISSPRIADSYDRALDLALHLADGADTSIDAAIADVVDEISELARQIIDLETRVAAIRPGELTAQIRRLDRRITDSDHADTTRQLIDEKSELRQQLTDRDAAQQRLQARAQQLHEITSRLEDLARQRANTDDAATLGDNLKQAVAFEFDELATVSDRTTA